MAKFDWILYRLIEKIKIRGGVDYKKSYAQCGEDLIMRHIFNALQITTPTYLDIGAHHPSYLNNTKVFYDEGARGVNIEPDPSLIAAFHKRRPRDLNLNVGVGGCSGTLPFYIMSTQTLNTFSEVEAKAVSREGKVAIEKVIDIPVVTVNDVIKDHFSRPPDIISLDVEGMDLAILRSLDFANYRPKVLCVETITFSDHRQGRKIPEIAEIMRDNRYFAYADTNVNTLFVDRGVW
jgi:FkbM family methyltransferase